MAEQKNAKAQGQDENKAKAQGQDENKAKAQGQDENKAKGADAKKDDEPKQRGRKARFAGKFIYKLVKDNPRREGSHGHRSFALIKDGMSYEDYIKAGGRVQDLAWDVEHKYVEVRDSKK